MLKTAKPIHPQTSGVEGAPEISSSGLDMQFSIRDGVFFSLMVGLGETYLAAFCLELHMTEVTAGLVTIVPVAIASAFQLFAGYGIRYTQSRRRWVVRCASVQATTLLGMAAMAGLDFRWPLAAYGISVVYWTSAMAAGPAWNAWISQLVEERNRLHFFAVRARMCQVAICIGMTFTGLALHLGGYVMDRLQVFAGVFLLASLCRFVSAYYLWRHGPDQFGNEEKCFSVKEYAHWFKNRDTRRIGFYLFSAGFSVYVAAPYFNPFMLGQLKLSYYHYLLVIVAAFVARVLSYPVFERIIQRCGVPYVMISCTLGICVVPVLWIFENSLVYLIGIQLLSGIAWGGYELGVTLILFSQYSANERSRVLSITNLMNSLGMLVGSLVGVMIMHSASPEIEDYHRAFWASSALRVLPLVFLPAFLRQPVKYRRVVMRILSAGPGMGTVIRPILGIPRASVKRFKASKKS